MENFQNQSITVLPSGRSFLLQPQETILNAAIRQGVGLPYGCKDGACGSCKCLLRRGRVTMLPFSIKALSAQEQQDGYVLTCRARASEAVAIESRQVTLADAFAIQKMPARVQALVPRSRDVMELQLQLPALQVFKYHAGQYIEFLLSSGARRAYSIALPPHEQARAPRLELHIRHLPGGLFTEQVFGSLKEKDILRIEGPFGSFYLREDSQRPIILLASGTGFAPIKAILEHMAHKRINRPVYFYWGARSPADLYLHDWVTQQAKEQANLHYYPVVSDAQAADGWRGRTGFVHQAVLDDFADLSEFEVYACGAPIMVESARAAYLASRQLPPERFFADSFTSAVDRLNSRD